MQKWAQKGQKQYEPNKNRKYEEEVVRKHRRTIQNNHNDTDNHNGVITYLEQTSWSVKSSRS